MALKESLIDMIRAPVDSDIIFTLLTKNQRKTLRELMFCSIAEKSPIISNVLRTTNISNEQIDNKLLKPWFADNHINCVLYLLSGVAPNGITIGQNAITKQDKRITELKQNPTQRQTNRQTFGTKVNKAIEINPTKNSEINRVYTNYPTSGILEIKSKTPVTKSKALTKCKHDIGNELQTAVQTQTIKSQLSIKRKSEQSDKAPFEVDLKNQRCEKGYSKEFEKADLLETTSQPIVANYSLDEKKLHSILSVFRQEIEQQKSVIIKEYSHIFTMRVARIYIDNCQLITEKMLQLVRQEIVGTIGIYQHQKHITPIFHSMDNMRTYIEIVCENHDSYKSLEKCIMEMRKTGQLNTRITYMPVVSHIVFWYDIIYYGIIDDPQLFLTQLKLHKNALQLANHWIIVSHKIDRLKTETRFECLIDEQSSLAIQYQYNSKMFICMHEVKFQLRAKLDTQATAKAK